MQANFSGKKSTPGKLKKLLIQLDFTQNNSTKMQALSTHVSPSSEDKKKVHQPHS